MHRAGQLTSDYPLRVPVTDEVFAIGETGGWDGIYGSILDKPILRDATSRLLKDEFQCFQRIAPDGDALEPWEHPFPAVS
jgi:hypothetical protein